MAWGFQLNFVEPWNTSEFHTKPKNRSTRDIASSLQSMYLPFQVFLQDLGETCLLRTICEAALHPFKHQETGLFEEIAHSILT
ncbi:hypothetical protein L9F63_000680, partial [Diploptera punctata]